jgi:WXG100 family type VII secretion target
LTVTEKVARYQACYNRIYAEVDNLATGWTGEASLAFITQIRGFESDFDSMKRLLEKYAEFLKVGGNNYQRSENIIIEEARTRLTFG